MKGSHHLRFVVAIACFIAAAVMIGVGVAQRTILLQPDEVVVAVEVEGDSSLTVIDGATLNSFDGAQTLTVRGDGTVFAAYGRTPDVNAWVGESEHTRIVMDAETGELVAEHVAGDPAIDPAAEPGTEPDAPAEGTGSTEGTPSENAADEFEPIPNPQGSDLWLEDYVEERSLRLTVNVPENISILIASDGTAPAPADVALSWPLDNSTPFAVPLILGGAIVLLAGLAALFWAIMHMRNSRGPRRKPQKMPKLPRQPRERKPSRKAIEQKASGRRALGRGMIAVPIVLAGSIVLAGCSPAAPLPSPAASPSASADPNAPQLTPPAASAQQIERIVARIAESAAEADAALDATLLEDRFTGPALDLRTADYAVRTADSSIATAAPPIPQGPVRVMLPQQTEDWPRTIFAITQDATDATVPPVAIFLIQNNARANYKVHYAMTLEPSAELPDLAPASVGAARLAGDSGVLKTAPGTLALAYADILAKDIESQVYLDFKAEDDSLRESVGLAARQALAASLPSTASMTFSQAPGSGQTIALATNDSGALVAVDVIDTTTVAPTEEGAAVNTSGAVTALSGVSVSTKGVTASYSLQLLFYVPAAGSNEKIALLGWAQGLISAKEIE
jgi:hypothetical protein